MRNITDLRINSRGRPPPSSEDFAKFERHFGLILPVDYAYFLSVANGGHPELDCIDSMETGTAGWGINHFYSLSGDRVGPESLWRVNEKWRPILGTEALVFAADGGGNQFFLDLSRTPAPAMVCYHDEEYRRALVAISFEDLLDRLHLDPDAI